MKHPKPKPAKRQVYALSDERDRMKIGVANDLNKRMQNLKTGTADQYTVHHVEETDYAIGATVEKRAHRILESYYGKGRVREWFTGTTPDEAIHAIQTAHTIERSRNDTTEEELRQKRKNLRQG